MMMMMLMMKLLWEHTSARYHQFRHSRSDVNVKIICSSPYKTYRTIAKVHYHANLNQNFTSSFQVIRYTTRNSSGDEIANVNFLYDDFVYVL